MCIRDRPHINSNFCTVARADDARAHVAPEHDPEPGADPAAESITDGRADDRRLPRDHHRRLQLHLCLSGVRDDARADGPRRPDRRADAAPIDARADDARADAAALADPLPVGRAHGRPDRPPDLSAIVDADGPAVERPDARADLSLIHI